MSNNYENPLPVNIDELTGDYVVYVLRDPRFASDVESIRYVGQSINPNSRQRAHCGHGFQTVDKSDWVDNMRRRGFKPQMVIVESKINCLKINERERHWVRHYSAIGCKLLNRPVGAIKLEDLASEEFYDNCTKAARMARDILGSMFPECCKRMPKNSITFKKLVKADDALRNLAMSMDDLHWDAKDRKENAQKTATHHREVSSDSI